MSKALVLGSGGLRGAYSGGVVSVLGQKLGCNYFDAVYACSAGSYTASYLLSGQPEKNEMIWRKCLHGGQLMKWGNIFSRRPILDLPYLNSVLQSGPYELDVDKVVSSPSCFKMSVTNSRGEAEYFSPKNEKDFYLMATASAAVPYLHPSVRIGKDVYVDGGVSDPLPVEKAIADGHDEIVVVWNKPQLRISNVGIFLLSLCNHSIFHRPQAMKVARKVKAVEDLVKRFPDRIKVIMPSGKCLMRWHFDSSEENINRLVDLGTRDALEFLRKQGL